MLKQKYAKPVRNLRNYAKPVTKLNTYSSTTYTARLAQILRDFPRFYRAEPRACGAQGLATMGAAPRSSAPREVGLRDAMPS